MTIFTNSDVVEGGWFPQNAMSSSHNPLVRNDDSSTQIFVPIA